MKKYSSDEHWAMVTGVKSVLKKMKEKGYIDKNIEFSERAIEDLAQRFYITALDAYESGFKSGIRETFQAIRDKNIAVEHTEDGVVISSKLKIFPSVKPLGAVILDFDAKKPGRLLAIPEIQMSDVLR